MTLTSNILALTGPKLSGMAVDAIHGKGNVEFPKVFFYCGMMLACYGISALFEWLLSRTLIRLSQKIVQQMRSDVFSHLMTLPVSFFDQHQTGDIISHISYDIDTINTSMSQDLSRTAVFFPDQPSGRTGPPCFQPAFCENGGIKRLYRGIHFRT